MTSSQKFLAQKEMMNPDNITPEMAAIIVKRYILPMFESTEKKTLKTKYNKMASINQNIGQNIKNLLP